VATHRGPTAYDKVHADAALDTVDGAHRLDKTVAKLARVVLFFFLDVVHQLTLFNKFLVPSPWWGLRNFRLGNFFLIGSSED